MLTEIRLLEMWHQPLEELVDSMERPAENSTLGKLKLVAEDLVAA